MNQFNDCIILFGGSSEERLVSVASAQNLSKHLPEAKLWYWSDDGKIYLVTHDELSLHDNAFTHEFKTKTPPVFESLSSAMPSLAGKMVIIGLHGTEGEDGKLQALLESNHVKYTGSNSQTSQIAFDKRATKRLAKEHGLPVVPDLAMNSFDNTEIKELESFLDQHKKIVLKPLANGSSVGLFIISNHSELKDAVDQIKSKTVIPYMSEPFITGRELTVGVWQKSKTETIPLPASEVQVIQGGQFDYQGKYLGKGVKELTPAPITDSEMKAAQELALKLHLALGCSGYTRTDMILNEKGLTLLEINTLPGLTKASFIPQQLAAINIDLRTFFDNQINLLK